MQELYKIIILNIYYCYECYLNYKLHFLDSFSENYKNSGTYNNENVCIYKILLNIKIIIIHFEKSIETINIYSANLNCYFKNMIQLLINFYFQIVCRH